MPNNYIGRILKVFAESYPGSAQFKGGRPLRKGDWDNIFADISDSPDNKEAFLYAVEELAAQGIISVKWIKYNKGNKVDALYLVSPAKMYECLNEDAPESIRESVLSFINSYVASSDLTMKIIEYIKRNYVSGDMELFNNYEDIRDILKLSEVSPSEVGKYNIRALSVRLFNKSKRIEDIKDKADKICLLCDEQTLTDKLGIDRKFPETSIAGNAVIEFLNGERWPLQGNIITLPLDTTRNIKNIFIPGLYPTILSIENKETFYILSKQTKNFDLYIYSGGRLNSCDKAVFRILSRNNGEFFHTGDLDPDGLKIFNEIDVLLGGMLKPYRMDIDTYNEYLEFGYQLSDGTLRYFDKYNNPKLNGLASEILKTAKGVEQEIIRYLDI